MYFLKLNKNTVIKTITWCKCFVFSLLASSSQLAARQAQAARYTQREHSRWAAGRNAEVLGQGRARWLWGTQSCQAAANGQQCLLLGAFLCRFFCFDFYHNPQARWFGDARILNPTDTLSSFTLLMLGSSAHMESVGPQLSIKTEVPGALTDHPPTHSPQL